MAVQVEKTGPKPRRAFPSGINDNEKGMTLRDYFAAHALQGLLACPTNIEDPAQKAYIMADAMLEERNKT